MAQEMLAGGGRATGASGSGELFRQPQDLPDPALSRNGKTVLEKRYLRREGKRALETPGGAFWRVATEIARGSARFADAATADDLARQYYLAMANLEFIPNSPTLMNAGKGNGLQYSACYVLPVGDSMEEIFETNKRAALIHQSGGGTGFAFSRLRPAGDVVGSTGGIASGPVSFLEVFNGSTESVKQGGTRRGANMGILRIDHPDVLKFIDCKRDLNERNRVAFESVSAYLSPDQQKTLKRALLEGQIANFNISVAVTDRFMEALYRDEDYELINPRTRAVAGKLNAKAVFQKMVEGAWETGDPGIVFVDRINAGPANPVPSMGPVEATNPCGEQPLYPNEACNLGSINLARFVKAERYLAAANGHHPANGYANGHNGNGNGNGHNGASNGHARNGVSHSPWAEAMDWERLEKLVRLSVRFLDDVIEVNPYPDQWIDEAVKNNRRIGLGVMGWADLLMMLELPYDSREALDLAETLMKFIQDRAADESIQLAKVRGPFPNWSRSIYKDGPPRRNATVTTIAPTGTISIIAGCSSGIEPIFALAFDRKGSLDGQLSIEVNDYFVETAHKRNFWTDSLAQQVARHGTARGVADVPEHWQRVFGTSHDIAPEWHVRMQGAWQKFTENAVSKTINLPHDASVEDVSKAYRLSYELGCSGITVYRDGSKVGVLHVGTGGSEAPAAPATPSATQSPAPAAESSVAARALRPRPRALRGMTFRQETPLGTAYITINEDEQAQPYEVFVNQGKAGSDVAALAEAIGKLTSVVLRTPSPMQPRERLTQVARKLRGIGGSSSIGFGAQRARSLPDAVAKVLEDYLGQSDAVEVAMPAPREQLALPLAQATTGEFCPDCGNALVYEEGCSKCMDASCGYSRC